MKLETAWYCLGIPPDTDCDESGTTDREAERHVKATGHATSTWMVPAGKRGAA